jgi:RecA/RadA recombinase
VTEAYGPEWSGKTTLCQHIVAEAQRRGAVWAYIDMEHALDPACGEKCGVEVACPGTIPLTSAMLARIVAECTSRVEATRVSRGSSRRWRGLLSVRQ